MLLDTLSLPLILKIIRYLDIPIYFNLLLTNNEYYTELFSVLALRSLYLGQICGTNSVIRYFRKNKNMKTPPTHELKDYHDPRSGDIRPTPSTIIDQDSTFDTDNNYLLKLTSSSQPSTKKVSAYNDKPFGKIITDNLDMHYDSDSVQSTDDENDDDDNEDVLRPIDFYRQVCVKDDSKQRKKVMKQLKEKRLKIEKEESDDNKLLTQVETLKENEQDNNDTLKEYDPQIIYDQPMELLSTNELLKKQQNDNYTVQTSDLDITYDTNPPLRDIKPFNSDFTPGKHHMSYNSEFSAFNNTDGRGTFATAQSFIKQTYDVINTTGFFDNNDVKITGKLPKMGVSKTKPLSISTLDIPPKMSDYYHLIKHFYQINHKFQKFFPTISRLSSHFDELKDIPWDDDGGKEVLYKMQSYLSEYFCQKVGPFVENEFMYITHINKCLRKILELHTEELNTNLSPATGMGTLPMFIGNQPLQINNATKLMNHLIKNNKIWTSPHISIKMIDTLLNYVLSENMNKKFAIITQSTSLMLMPVSEHLTNVGRMICMLATHQNLNEKYIIHTLSNFTNELWLWNVSNGTLLENPSMFYHLITSIYVLMRRVQTIDDNIIIQLLDLIKKSVDKFDIYGATKHLNTYIKKIGSMFLQLLCLIIPKNHNPDIQDKLVITIKLILKKYFKTLEGNVESYNILFKYKLIEYLEDNCVFNDNIISQEIMPKLLNLMIEQIQTEKNKNIIKFLKDKSYLSYIMQHLLIYNYMGLADEMEEYLTSFNDCIEDLSKLIFTCDIRTHLGDYLEQKIKRYDIQQSIEIVANQYFTILKS